MPPEFDMRAARDEIERLQKENLELNVAIMGPDQIRAHQGCIIEDQAKRIAELEGAAKADEGRLIEAAKKARIEYFGCDTPDHLADRIVELESRLKLLQGHNYVNATPDGSYALRILQSYRAMCDMSVSDVIDAPPTNPLCIEMNKVNDARKKELDSAIELLSSEESP